jgi:hypothetical protein
MHEEERHVWIDLFEFICWHKHLRECFGKTYHDSLWHVHKLFSAYFYKFSRIAYENSLTLFYLLLSDKRLCYNA